MCLQPFADPERRQLPGAERSAPTMATPDAEATVGSRSRWLPYGGQQGATALRPSTPPESGEPLEISLTASPLAVDRGAQR